MLLIGLSQSFACTA